MTGAPQDAVASRRGNRGGRAERLASQLSQTLAASTARSTVLSVDQERAFRARTRRVDLIAARYVAAELHRAWGVRADG